MEVEINSLWKIIAIFLVLSMQAGFLMLEGGRVRSKNSINVAQKNVTDLVVTWVGFFAIGFTIMFGVSIPELLHNNATLSGPDVLDFIYQFCFCCTAATIVSGAISERISFRAYMVMVLVISTILYPLIGRLVWGNTFDTGTFAPLAQIGFIDFAGSSVVHGMGAWFGLVALIMLGPRAGRFDSQGNVQVLAAHNSVVALFGVLVLMFGWIGFNGGSVSVSGPLLKVVIFNTLSAAVFGAASGMMVGAWLDKGLFNPGRVATGMLGGLVACTASVHFMGSLESILVGASGGAFASYSAHILLHRYKLDDPVDAIATHGLAGVLGTLAVAFVAPEKSLVAGSRIAQLGVQSLGVLVIAAISAFICWVSILFIQRFMEFRVSEHAEAIGLNYTEHGESVGLTRLQNALEQNAGIDVTITDQTMTNLDDEHSELASALNKVVNKYEQANQQIVAANERFQQFAETASDWLWEADERLVLTYIHANSNHSNGFDESQFLGQELFQMLTVNESVLAQIRGRIELLHSLPVFESTIQIDQICAASMVVEVRAVPYDDIEGKFLGYRGTITDISSRKDAENRAVFLSLHDELTGLSNRRALSVRLPEILENSRKSGRATVIAGLDLDGFKAVNDAYGHLVGDALLQGVSNRLEIFLRSSDHSFRTGGDEFIVVLTDLDPVRAENIASNVMQHMIDEISAIYSVQAIDIRIGASIGIATFPAQSTKPEELLHMVDLALYEAKSRGKGCVVNFDTELDVDAKLQLSIEAELHNATEEQEFYLEYQPQVDTQSGRIIGFEALLRWQHPQRGIVPPGDFIGMAEKLNLMDRIGSYVLDRACEFAATWPVAENGTAYRISVNVSPQQFRNKTFCQTVRETLDRHNLPAERLEIEITEEILVYNFQEVSELLSELRAMNVSVAIDDFGSGQTSLRYLSQFPISTIKIDRSFIKNLISDGKAAEITQTLVGLGQRLGVKVLAEGVEDDDQLALLRSWNCDQIQGFLFSRPLSAENALLSMGDNSLYDKGRQGSRAA